MINTLFQSFEALWPKIFPPDIFMFVHFLFTHPLYRWTEHSADFFPKITTEGRKMATKITPRGWIFWTMMFYHLKKFTSRSI